RAAMGAETGCQAVADEADGGKGMRDLVECAFGAPATNAGKANSGVHPREIVARQPGLGGGCFGGLHDGPPGLLDANPSRRRSRSRSTEHLAAFVLNQRAAAGSTAIDAEIRGTFC